MKTPGGLAFEIEGDGAPLLLIRPLGGTKSAWGTFRSLLAQRHRVIAFDLRGSGGSSGKARWSTRAIARDACQLLDALQVERTHVFGISLGGMAATWLAIDAPARVAKLCVASAPPLGLELSHAKLTRAFAMAACFARPRLDVEPALVTRVLSSAFRSAHPAQVERIARVVAETPSSRASLLRHALAGVLHHPGAALARITAPTLVLGGDHDALLGSAPPRQLAAAIPNADFRTIQGSGHDLTLEQPARTAQVLLEFLA